MTFDPTKPVRTRDGRSARIICTDRNGPNPIAALVTCNDGLEYPVLFDTAGQSVTREQDMDLVNIPVKHKREFWSNEYPNHTTGMWRTREQADAVASSERIACVHVTYEFTEGEGL